MPYDVVFSGETHKDHQLAQRALLVGSVPFQEEENQEKLTVKMEKSQSAILALQNKVKQLDFLLADSLCRYNFELIGSEGATAQEQALERGRQWMAQYKTQDSLANVGTKDVLHWSNTVLQNSHYTKLLSLTQHIYENDLNGFKPLVLATAADRLKFMAQKKQAIRAQDPLEKCIQYVLEECAAVLIFRIEQVYDSLVYIQGKLNEPTQYMATQKLTVSSDDPYTALVADINRHTLKVITVAKTHYTAPKHANRHGLANGAQSRAASTQPSHSWSASNANLHSLPKPNVQNDKHTNSESGNTALIKNMALHIFLESPAIPDKLKLQLMLEILQLNDNKQPATVTLAGAVFHSAFEQSSMTVDHPSETHLANHQPH